MSLPKSYLQYPNRKHGMDHSLYPYSNLFERKPVSWPERKRVALWVTVALEYFPLVPNDKPFRAPGHMVTPYPDYRTYTTREYGNRVGVFRILKVLDDLGIKASFPMSAVLCKRYPFLLEEITGRGHEIVGHGMDMNALHTGGMDIEVERNQIITAVDLLQKTSKQDIAGWVSPARSQSENTLELLVEQGLKYVGDWVNDDMPYQVTTPAGTITAMPHTMELEDRHLLVNLGQNEETYHGQVLAAFEQFRVEAGKYGGRILHLSLTPYVIGQAWRIRALRDILRTMAQTQQIWSASGAEIAACWQEQQD